MKNICNWISKLNNYFWNKDNHHDVKEKNAQEFTVSIVLVFSLKKKMYFYRKTTSETADDEDSMSEGEEKGVISF